MKLIMIAIILLLFTAGALAGQGDVWFNIHLGSTHLNRNSYTEIEPDTLIRTDKEFNQQNLGIGISYELIRGMEARAGVYQNSFYKNSAYLGTALHTSYRKPIAFALQAGIVSGYKHTSSNRDKNIAFYIMPTISANVEFIRTEIGYIPKVSGDNTSSVVTVSMGLRF